MCPVASSCVSVWVLNNSQMGYKASWLSKAFLGNTKTRNPNFKYPNPSLKDSSTSKDDLHTFFYDVYSNNA